MANIFGDMKKQIAESKARWEEITKLRDTVANRLEQSAPRASAEEICRPLAQLVILMVDQFKPVGEIGAEADKLHKEIVSMLDMFNGEKK
jgi:uncharacterized coiled-coil DUF342 family protein